MILIPANDVVSGIEVDATKTMYPSRMFVPGSNFRESDETRSSYGYVVRGAVSIIHGPDAERSNSYLLSAGSYFALPGPFALIHVESSLVIIIQRFGYRCLPHIGQCEEKGRLSYIDGCSDTLLIPPARLGDPSLNLLYFPKGINQTQHTHPSIRMGIVAKGAGTAWQLTDGYGKGWEKPLIQGNIFMLEEQELHSFRTTDHDSDMTIIAYHPDGDWGPEDTKHPMLNRTYINHGLVGGQSGARS